MNSTGCRSSIRNSRQGRRLARLARGQPTAVRRRALRIGRLHELPQQRPLRPGVPEHLAHERAKLFREPVELAQTRRWDIFHALDARSGGGIAGAFAGGMIVRAHADGLFVDMLWVLRPHEDCGTDTMDEPNDQGTPREVLSCMNLLANTIRVGTDVLDDPYGRDGDQSASLDIYQPHSGKPKTRDSNKFC